MKEVYERLNEQVRPSSDLVNRTVNAVKAEKPRRSGSFRRMRLIPAIVLIAALLVAAPALAANLPEMFNYLQHYLGMRSQELAEALQPVSDTCTNNGVTVSVFAVDVDESGVQFYLTVQGERINEQTAIYEQYNYMSIRRQNASENRIPYTSDPHTAVFRVYYAPIPKNQLDENNNLTFTIDHLLLDRTTTERAVEGFQFVLENGEIIDVSDQYFEYYSADGLPYEYAALKPGTMNVPVTEGVTITAAGYVNGQFHIQTRREPSAMTTEMLLWIGEKNMPDDLVENRMSRHYSGHSITFRLDGDDSGAVYTDHAFNVKSYRLKDMRLYVSITETGEILEGPWTITFPLENYTRDETN